MPLDELRQAQNIIIGTKQTVRLLSKGQVKKVFLADDADREVINPILFDCQKQLVCVSHVASKKELGKACGIEVNCAVAAIVD